MKKKFPETTKDSDPEDAEMSVSISLDDIWDTLTRESRPRRTRSGISHRESCRRCKLAPRVPIQPQHRSKTFRNQTLTFSVKRSNTYPFGIAIDIMFSCVVEVGAIQSSDHKCHNELQRP